MDFFLRWHDSSLQNLEMYSELSDYVKLVLFISQFWLTSLSIEIESEKLENVEQHI